MSNRFVAAIGPAILTLCLAVAVTQIVRGGLAASEGPDAERPAAAPDRSIAFGSAPTTWERGVAGAYAGALAQAEVAAYWQAVDHARSATSGSGSGRSRCADALACIRECESHGNYSSVSSGGTYRGAYQFSQSAWESVGGTGDPAAATPAEQDARAAALYGQRGSAPWANCA